MSGERNAGVQKSVNFPDDEAIAVCVCTLPNREDTSEEEQEALFFSKSEYQVSRSAARILSKESQRQGYSQHLDDTFSEKNTEAQDKLNVWAAHGNGRRGLERWANREHGDKRQQDQFAAIQAVLEAQDEMLGKGKEIDPEKLRKVSYKATKMARHFARMMGKADSYALAHELKTCDETSISAESATVATTVSSSNMSTDSDASFFSEDDISMPRIDELHDSHHEKSSLFSRLKFRRQRSNRSNSKHEGLPHARVS